MELVEVFSGRSDGVVVGAEKQLADSDEEADILIDRTSS